VKATMDQVVRVNDRWSADFLSEIPSCAGLLVLGEPLPHGNFMCGPAATRAQ
jgi:hypothetical protein